MRLAPIGHTNGVSSFHPGWPFLGREGTEAELHTHVCLARSRETPPAQHGRLKVSGKEDMGVPALS